MFSDDDRTFMQNAIDLAHHASSENEVPVGAVLVDGDKIVGKGYNKVIQSNDVSAHAEIIAIRDAIRSATFTALLLTYPETAASMVSFSAVCSTKERSSLLEPESCMA